jgi:hypothetical protein
MDELRSAAAKWFSAAASERPYGLAEGALCVDTGPGIVIGGVR